MLENRVYQPIAQNAQGQLVSQALGLALVRWKGIYKGINITWLRWATLDGQLLPNSEEIAAQEKLRADSAESQLRQVAANLLQQGMTVEQVAQLTALSESEVREIAG